METALIAIAAAIAIGLSTLGPALAQGKTASAAMEGIARQDVYKRQTKTR